MTKIEWDIIEKKLEGKLTPEEEECFGIWYTERKENAAYFHNVEDFYHRNGCTDEISDETVENSWKHLQKQIKPVSGKINHRRWLYLVTGGLAACVVMGLLLLLPERNMSSGRDALPLASGDFKARLTLSSGQVVELQDKAEEISESAAKIISSGNVLSYIPKNDSSEYFEEYNRVETPKGGEYVVLLADGSKIWLGPMTELKYPVVFSKDKRQVQISGEAYLEVAPDTSSPFIVSVGGMEIKVLGTSFNVKGYPDEEHITTTLVSGKVQVSQGGNSCILSPEEQAVLDKHTRQITTREVNVDEYIDWKNGKINIRNQRLEDILKTLERWYDIEVFYVNPEAKDLCFYANVNRYADLKELLNKFEKTGLVIFDIKDKTIRVRAVN